MAYSYNRYTGTGAQTQFVFEHPFINRTHVDVKVDGVSVPFTWITDGLVNVTTAPANGTVVDVRRTTPVNVAIVDFTNGSVVTEEDLDLANLQHLYHTQEVEDFKTEALQQTVAGVYDAQNKRITNVATPTATADAATKSYVDGTFAASVAGHSIGAHNDTVSHSMAAGNLLVGDAGNANKYNSLPIGNDLDVLEVKNSESKRMRWISLALKLFQLLTTKGDLAVSTGATTVRLPVGANGAILNPDSGVTNGVKWSASGYSAKGDIVVATAAATPVSKSVGADNTVLRAASGQTDGLEWQDIGASQAEVNAMASTTKYLTPNNNKIVLGTLVSASTTTVGFTNIPAGVRRITLHLNGISTSGTDNLFVQIGASGGIENTGYNSTSMGITNAAATSVSRSTVGFLIAMANAANTLHGSMTMTLMDSVTNLWSMTYTIGLSSSDTVFSGAGTKALSSVLDRVRIITAATDTFDAGSINITYER